MVAPLILAAVKAAPAIITGIKALFGGKKTKEAEATGQSQQPQMPSPQMIALAQELQGLLSGGGSTARQGTFG